MKLHEKIVIKNHQILNFFKLWLIKTGLQIHRKIACFDVINYK